MRGKWADLLPSIPEGENYLWHTDRGGGLRCSAGATLLELPAEAREEAVVDDPGAAGSGNRPISLGESAAERAKALSASDLS